MSGQHKWVGLLAVSLLAFMPEAVWAITITSPVMPGDVFAVKSDGTALYQFRYNSTPSTVTGLTNLGGVTTDPAGNLWFAHGDGSSVPFQIEMIPFAGTTSTVKLSGATLNAPANTSGIRDLTFDSSGNLYVSFYLSNGSLSLSKYLPDGAGGFVPGSAVGSFGGGFGDYGAGRLNLSANGLIATTASWSSQNLYSLRITDGGTNTANLGPNMVAGQTQTLPVYPDRLLYSAADGVRWVSFNPTTGAIGTTSSQLLVGGFNDGLVYSAAAGRLYLSNRANGGEIRFATDAQLAQAMSNPGTVNIANLGRLLQSSNAYINRDLAVVEPPPYPGVVQQGDVWLVDASLRSVHQFRGGAKVSTFTLNTDDTIGGVATDADANLYIAGSGLGVYRIDRNSNQVAWLLKPDEVAGVGQVRDVAVASDGTLYITYYGQSGRVDKFTPDGAGGYTRTQLGATGLTNADRGNHHSWLTNNGKYLLVSARNDNKIVAMDTSTGALTSWSLPSGNLVGEIALDPFTNNYVLFCGGDVGSAAPYQLFALSFDPNTGAFGTTPIDLNTDADDWVDALAFDPLTGDLYMSVRYNQLVKATYAQYLLALAGSPFDIDLLPRVYTGSEVNIARDMVVTNRVPEPAAWMLLVLGMVGLVLARRRKT